ncbi:MAG TPA: hypothetical protein VE621_07995 [Bryobacteraceae bacterium]|jgi:hypothetical protein|nr:hypothetical protein [Bryobacteraceae bacterium]
MSSPATYEDVNLIVRLYELRREEKLRTARDWFSKSFKVKSMEEFGKVCPPGYDTNTYFRMVTSYWEMVASFVTSGVLNEELLFQSGLELLFVWERIKDLVPEMRAIYRNQGQYKNLEIVAERFSEMLNRNGGPEAYRAFSARVRG